MDAYGLDIYTAQTGNIRVMNSGLHLRALLKHRLMVLQRQKWMHVEDSFLQMESHIIQRITFDGLRWPLNK